MPACDTEDVSDLAPSAKLVYKVLEYNGKLTQKQIAQKSRLSPRTVRYALNELESAGVVEDDIYFADARQRLYQLTESDIAGPE
ncbi:winged helix-turn-helix domain-containing protein [Haloarcula sp. CGMCC 1.2071]|uniref:winged helix-turn-helix domain-containing protein n=1 Tax=Haloarcula sp. CGMCC 1.2071 TaxID=3111454 RepID=UPI00300EBCE1